MLKSKIFKNFSISSRIKLKRSNINIIKDTYSIIHGHYKYDSYNSIKTNQYEQKEIIKRENLIFEKWKKMFESYYREWETDAYSITNNESPKYGEECGGYEYFEEEVEGYGYDIFKRRRHFSQEEEVVLDIKTIPFIKNIDTTNLKHMRISGDGRLVSFVLDIDNNEKYYGGIYDITSRIYYNTVFDNTNAIEFADDYVFIIENNKLNRPCKIKLHKIDWSNPHNTGSLVLEEYDQEVYIETNPTKDNNYLTINFHTKNDSKISIINLKSDFKKNIEIITLFERTKGIKYFIEHAGSGFYIFSNMIIESDSNPELSKNENYKLFYINDDQVQNISQNLKLLVFPENDEIFEDLDIFKTACAIYYKKNLQPYVLIHDLSTKLNKRIKIGDKIGEITPGLNKGFDVNKLIVEYSSPITMKTRYEIDLNIKESKIIYSSKINYDSSQSNIGKKLSDMTLSTLNAPGKDGEGIPLTILHRKDTKLNRKNKTLLIGYGAYGLNLELNYNHHLFTAASKGWVIAFAHLRGGNEKGKTWHEQGRLLNKQNVIDDYLSCGYELIQAGFTHPNYLAGYGASSGGSVIAQAINLEPKLFRAVVLDHPFLDILNTLFDDTLPLTITDYLEYGNPLIDDKIYFSMLSYSPYDNISNQEYPSILINMSLDDTRVPSWGTLKYIQKLRNKAKNPITVPNFLEKNICVKIDQAGHFGPLNQDDSLKAKIWDLMWLDKMLIEKDSFISS